MRQSLLIVLALLPILLGAAWPEAWENWLWSRPIEGSAEMTGLVRVTLTSGVFGRAREDLADLRVIDAAGDEVPYVLQARKGQRSLVWRSAQISDVGFVEGQYTQFIADVRGSAQLHNAVELSTPESDFFTWVEVAASDDREAWRVVRERAPVYRFRDDGIAGNSNVSYPDTTSRWLRVRVLQVDRAFPISSCRVGLEVVEEAELAALPSRLEPVADPPEGTSRWEADLEWTQVPVTAVRFDSEQAAFHRHVRVYRSEDGGDWNEAGQGEIYRFRGEANALGGGADRNSRLRVDLREQRGRYWRVDVLDRNDRPLAGIEASLVATPRHVVFRAESGEEYRLLYGNSRADAPIYDLDRLTSRDEALSAPGVDLGGVTENIEWVNPEPWTERNPALLWFVLVLAAVALAWFAIRALR